jgi:phosphate transport system substrate-binding protein
MSPRVLVALLFFLLMAQTGLAEGPRPSAATLSVKGSDTVGGELGPALARAFEATSPSASVRWEGLGSATAVPGLLDGSADLGASSRPVNAQELAQAKRAGIELREYVLGYDGIAVIVHPSNGVRALTVAQLSALFSGKVRSWRELGGPDLAPAIYSRPSYSGTHSFFKAKVLRKGATEAAEFAPGTTFVERSEALLAAVSENPAAVGYLGMGWARPGVSVPSVSTRQGAAPVKATADSVRSGSYPISRPLLLYTRGEPQGELRRFLQFILAGEGRRLISEHGFIPGDVPALLQRVAATEPAPARSGPPRVGRIYFQSGSAAVGPEAERFLNLAAGQIRARGTQVLLIGHADSQGRPEENLRLARRRAEVVADELARRGVPRRALAIEARGADVPLATNDTQAGRRANRRVDLEIAVDAARDSGGSATLGEAPRP